MSREKDRVTGAGVAEPTGIFFNAAGDIIHPKPEMGGETMGQYKELPADATACPKCGGIWGYKSSDMCLDVRAADWSNRIEESEEIRTVRVSRSSICMDCGYRFARPK